MAVYLGVSDVARQAKKLYIGVGGVAREVTRMYASVGGAAKLVWPPALFVAVGNNGAIAYSANGVSWTQITVGSKGWYGVAYGNGKWVAVGSSGAIAYSTDNGATWTQITVGSKVWNGVAYGGEV